MINSPITLVAVAIIKNKHNEVLVALRQDHQHQGGLWEFPGGKVEKDEAVYEALCREINEELGLTILSAIPLMELEHQYSDKAVHLDIWCVDKFEGKAQGREGQTIRWISVADLNESNFPVANVAIINKLRTGE